MESDILAAIFLGATIHSFFLAIVLLGRAAKNRGLGWLGLVVFTIGFWLLNYLFYLSSFINSNPHLLGVFVPILYIMGPAYYFFVLRSTHKSHRFRWFDLFHLVVPLYVLWEWWPVYFHWTVADKLMIIEQAQSFRDPTFWQILMANRRSIVVLAYVIAAYIKLRQINWMENGPWRTVRWLRNFSLIFGFMLVLFVLVPYGLSKLDWDNTMIIELLFIILLTILVHGLGYSILSRDALYGTISSVAVFNKYHTSPLTHVDVMARKNTVLEYMERRKPWLNPQFSIKDLADDLDIPKHHMSQILNEGLQRNFYDLVSWYRINAIKKRLREDDIQVYSILGIAKDCGFRSKSSFNRAFKKIVGMTPSEWINQSASTVNDCER